MMSNVQRLEAVETLQNILVAYATGKTVDHAEYTNIRTELLNDRIVSDSLPRFVRTCRNLSQFWPYIQQKFATYAERRTYLWESFEPIITSLEVAAESPIGNSTTETLTKLDPVEIHRVWQTALERRSDDSEGAITSARSLLETVCKYILDSFDAPYSDKDDLPKLYRLTAQQLSLAPDQQSEEMFKRAFSGCQTVVNSLAEIRNRFGDAHGKGSNSVKPSKRHAELAVNLSGSIAVFLVSTWQEFQDDV